MGRSENRKQDGFSLVEVLVALTILAVGLLALALLQTTAIKGNTLASKTTVATQLAQDRLEQFRHTAWGEIVSSPAGGYNTATMKPLYSAFPGSQGDVVTVRGTDFYRAWFVTSDSPTMRTITVWACWQDDRQIWHNVMLVTRRTNVGV